MNGRVVLLVSEADGWETTHVRQQVILQHILIVFAVHPVGNKNERRLAEGGKSGPAKSPLGEVARLLPQITPVICEAVGPIKIELLLVTPNDLDEKRI